MLDAAATARATLVVIKIQPQAPFAVMALWWDHSHFSPFLDCSLMRWTAALTMCRLAFAFSEFWSLSVVVWSAVA